MAVQKSREAMLARAREFMARVPFLDGHNDMPWVLRESAARGDVAAYGLDRRHPETDTDLPRLREGQVAAQVWAAFIPTSAPHPARTVLEQIDIVRQANARHSDILMAATRADDVAEAHASGRIASFLAIEGGVGLEGSLAPLRIWHAAGARLMTLCHNETLDWVDSATDAPRVNGLSAFGRAVVRELNRLGMIIDCAHVAPSVMHQVLDITRAPIVFSHSNARALCDHPRNVPDDVLDRVKANGGLVMATFIPGFLSEPRRHWEKRFENEHGVFDMAALDVARREVATDPRAKVGIAMVADHIEYIAGRCGVEHVGIGSDFFGEPLAVTEGLEDVSRFPWLFAELMTRGWSDEHLAGLASGNFLRAFRKVEAVGSELAATEAPCVGTLASLDGPAAEDEREAARAGSREGQST
ncbi:MAG: dipeptidase [Hyphomicrobiaceae bacterium]